jgi:hypothetical protein
MPFLDPQHYHHLKSGLLVGDGGQSILVTDWMRANATLVCRLPLTFFLYLILLQPVFFQFLSIKTLDPDPHSLEMLDPDPQHWPF